MADSHKSAKDKEGHNLGWPHYDKKGNCLCYCSRCMGTGGCICKFCAGHNHSGCKQAHICDLTETCPLSGSAGSSAAKASPEEDGWQKVAEVLATPAKS